MLRSAPPDLGHVVHFEHVNYRVPDHRIATLYFIEGLGLTRDPYRMVGTSNMWVNVGTQQFHLPIGEPSVLPGEVGVVLPEFDRVRKNLAALGPALAGTPFAWQPEGETLLVTTPWGHRQRLHPQGLLPGLYPLGLPYVEFWVPPGTAAGIGAFYAQYLGCPVEQRPVAEDVAVRVTVGTYQEFRFRERPDAQVVQSRNHVAIYMTRYKATYDRMLEQDLVMEEDVGDQFRFCKMVNPADGHELFVFEHEVRSLFHEGFRRRLVNRTPMPERID